MAGTPKGGKKTEKVLKQRYGEDYYKIVGAKGGAAPHKGKKGFASMTPERLSEIGRIGGRNSKRT